MHSKPMVTSSKWSSVSSKWSILSIRNVIPTFLNTIYAHDPAASVLNLDPKSLKFNNPLSVFYVDSPSKELVDQIVQGAGRLTATQVPEFVGLAATILKAYKARDTNHKDANNVCTLFFTLDRSYGFFCLENSRFSTSNFQFLENSCRR